MEIDLEKLALYIKTNTPGTYSFEMEVSKTSIEYNASIYRYI